ncbi:hypothetical protein WJX72_011829 [[Myrmecia] bisecta]|uniref:Uncharacterized protein n=1 Tax=[Myrmecia] bisecta TaxID=41462 RepID=A0AAW1Q0W8_9CHLO
MLGAGPYKEWGGGPPADFSGDYIPEPPAAAGAARRSPVHSENSDAARADGFADSSPFSTALRSGPHTLAERLDQYYTLVASQRSCHAVVGSNSRGLVCHAVAGVHSDEVEGSVVLRPDKCVHVNAIPMAFKPAPGVNVPLDRAYVYICSCPAMEAGSRRGNNEHHNLHMRRMGVPSEAMPARGPDQAHPCR